MSKIIGIDPGVHTGLAVWDTEIHGFSLVETMNIVAAMDAVQQIANGGEDVVLVAEDARQRIWIPREKSISEYRGKMMGAGSVKRDSQIWEEFAKYNVLPLILVPPKNNRTKLKAEPFRKLTGWTGRTTEHSRDAAMLVFGRTNNPSTPTP